MAQTQLEGAQRIGSRFPKLTFILDRGKQFGPRVGRLCLTRPSDSPSNHVIDIRTPNFLIGTSRGAVPHFSRDHVHSAKGISWINVSFESFLEQTPPVPTYQTGSQPLHNFLGFDSSKHIVSLSLRDPLDAREMPPNGNSHVSASCMRGVRKVTLADWRSYVLTMQPDIAFALSDTPFTVAPHSQKRLTKSIERSAAWLADLLRPVENMMDDSFSESTSAALNVFVHMAGGTSTSARRAFSHSLMETLYGLEADAVKPLLCLDEGVAGYAFDLAALHNSELLAQTPTPNTAGTPTSLSSSMIEPLSFLSLTPTLDELLRASLDSLPIAKPRLVTDVRSPHEILCLIRDIGVDVFDAGWAVKAADIGVALDFIFPVPSGHDSGPNHCKRDIGHNLYDAKYAHDFVSLSDAFLAGHNGTSSSKTPVCPCAACSPVAPTSPIYHSKVDVQSHQAQSDDGTSREQFLPPFTRAYLHHLLHTHEMSAHTLLVAHNVVILDALLTGVRTILSGHADQNEAEVIFAREVTRFEEVYDGAMSVLHTARDNWKDVKYARGKGRLLREAQKEKDVRL
ncbi:tRNA-guanine(15) transglycosylase-like protein [Suillus subaureus]|uniref:tRNA-guanine(15) transglycosylase-like protein n=1 Tax=Suillus subaureus TaxID=48587 RepID=A0A9P7E5K5_9AGAM|nr:tRNA-guanine(15) transglycosylase-like protein [Suillus subaureus]KAG1811866.1 tRNA-guanine(15) transglycosylase-like protein [Suillus subaureus]